ncbi:MAG: hypothetical protein PF569_03665 [Candidatus Woesearchaeota archaeon]|jgi:hypothetical protein|nr:hypothetical protein [Candidatus Woesearchaeota archaeon]
MLLSILAFLYITIGLSFIIDLFVEYKANLYEQLAMRIGAGIMFFTILGIIMNLLFIPLNILIYILFATILIAIQAYKNKFNFKSKKISALFKVKSKKEIFYLVSILIMFIVLSFTYIGGSFKYSYMEDYDPWGYTLVSKVIAEEQTFSAPYKYDHYSEPYPQGYQVFMGVIHQSNDSIYWTMKFFHNLVLGLGMLFFFFFVKELFKLQKNGLDIAFFSSIAFFAVPSWVSHFIFSLSFNMTLTLVFLYFLLKINENKNWRYVVGILLGSLLVNHFFTGFIMIGILLGYYFLKVLATKEFNREILDSLLLGLGLSLLFYIPTLFRHSFYISNYVRASMGGLESFLPPIVNNLPILFILLIGFILSIILIYTNKYWFKYIKNILNIKYIRFTILMGSMVFFFLLNLLPFKLLEVEGSSSRIYTFSDYFFATSQNMINNPIGWGIFFSIFFLIGVYFLIRNSNKFLMKKNFGLLFVGYFTFFILILTQGVRLSITFMPFRMWTYLAIFASIIVGFSIALIYSGLNKNSKALGAIFGIIVIILILSTSFVAKYGANNSMWPDHRIMVPQSLGLYGDLRDDNLIPKGSKIVNLCSDSDYLIAYDFSTEIINEEFNRDFKYRSEDLENEYEVYHEFLKGANNNEIYSFLKKYNFEYFVVGASCRIKTEEDVKNLNDNLVQITSDEQNRFTMLYKTETEFLFKVN